jgi:hypothetical protein
MDRPPAAHCRELPPLLLLICRGQGCCQRCCCRPRQLWPNCLGLHVVVEKQQLLLQGQCLACC